MPTIRKKLELLVKFAPLFSHWECKFLENVYDGIDGTPQFLNDESIKDYLYENQIEKIKEIWETYSPHLNKLPEKEVRRLMETILLHKGWERLPSPKEIPSDSD